MSAPLRHPVNWRSWIAAAFSLVLLTGAFLVVHRELKHFQLRDVLAYLHQIPAPVLIAAALCTIGSYLLLGMYDFAGLRYVGKRLPYGRVALRSFITYAVVNNAGATVLTGAAMRMRLYAAHGLTGAEVATLQGFCSLTTALGITTLIALSLLFVGDRAVTTLHLLRPWTWVVGLVLLGGVATYVSWASLARRGIEFRGWALRPPGPLLASLQVALGAVGLSVACSVLWLLLPSSAQIGLPAFVGVFSLALAADAKGSSATRLLQRSILRTRSRRLRSRDRHH